MILANLLHELRRRGCIVKDSSMEALAIVHHISSFPLPYKRHIFVQAPLPWRNASIQSRDDPIRSPLVDGQVANLLHNLGDDLCSRGAVSDDCDLLPSQ